MIPLYASEQEIAALVLGPGKLKEWRAVAIIFERSGMPQIDPVTGCRYWPAVKAYLDRRYGIAQGAPPTVPDGAEQWHSKSPALKSEREQTANVHSIGLPAHR